MPTAAEPVRLVLNGREVSAPTGATVLEAARAHHIYVPTLCAHEGLAPFGGCRMCIVEIEGMRGLPTACTTLVAEGMSVRTESELLGARRRDLLELILSEHPSSCLICPEGETCKQNSHTTRKVGVTTGCRYCPNDSSCEVQRVIDHVGLPELSLPIMYRGFQPEFEDPFYDRDYNLCILCGRCVRECQEVRGASVLAFVHRGPLAIVGPAFGRSHVEAGCEFCGSCVDVCPTGALAERVSKWDGSADGSVESTCPYCGIGCTLELHHKGGRLSHALPAPDREPSHGEACLLGRFCLGEVAQHYERLLEPKVRVQGRLRQVAWKEALDQARDRLAGVDPADFMLLVSPDLTNESLFAAQYFARKVMDSPNVDSSVRRYLGELGWWTRLLSGRTAVADIRRSSAILVVSLDPRFAYSVISPAILAARGQGARLGVIDSRETLLARGADVWYEDESPETLERAVAELAGDGLLTVLVGPDAVGASSIEALHGLARREDVNLIPLYPGANTRGALELGAFGELLSGPRRAEAAGAMTSADVLAGRATPRVLYLVGDVPFSERPACETLIVQDLYAPDFDADLLLPAASFCEEGGTFINVEGRLKRLAAVEALEQGEEGGGPRPDGWILARIAKALDRDFGSGSAMELLAAIRKVVPGLEADEPRGFPEPELLPLSSAADGQGWERTGDPRLSLLDRPGLFTHRGVPLASKVEGLALLADTLVGKT